MTREQWEDTLKTGEDVFGLRYSDADRMPPEAGSIEWTYVRDGNLDNYEEDKKRHGRVVDINLYR